MLKFNHLEEGDIIVGIYKINDNLNHKCYIGQSIDIEKRIYDHFNVKRKNPKMIDKIIRDFGVQNFSYEILEECDIEDLNEREIYYINKFDARNKSKGYNTQIGGSGAKVFHKIIDIDTLEIWDGLKQCVDDTKEDVGSIVRVCNHHMSHTHGRRFMYLDEYEANGAFEYTPIYHDGKSKKVYCIDRDEIFESCHDAGNKLNLNFRLISAVCNNKRKTTGGLRFKYID